MEEGGVKKLNEELTDIEIKKVLEYSIESLERAKHIKIFLAKLEDRECDTTDI